jgi:hypothetical protein
VVTRTVTGDYTPNRKTADRRAAAVTDPPKRQVTLTTNY